MKSFISFIEKIRNNLKKPLPAEASHKVMEALSAKYLDLKPDEQTRKSAVLILLYPHKNEVYFPLILRPLYNGFHSGEIGLPGGRYELTDKDLIQTALRETEEEIGVKIEDIQVLGTLTEIYIGPSNFFVLPVVGYLPHRPDFIADEYEVEEILEVKLNYFADPKIIDSATIPISNDLVLTPYYKVKDHKVWGASAKMINELLSVSGENVSF
ncbi:NUDIX domain-containing protein [Flavobacterium sp. 270]|uniref:NUDIX hydrolase n=1 Tax=Flavobacterium sp. 270 TaxID=2512114 RepID=UPI001064900A|nr:CoA pyrophosphatase [Flavobacterium sp. 270]TDW48117.1 NUDIX domain-containing protein [Flavobacterium sp. 270]